MSVTVTQELTQQTVTVTGNPVENNVTVTVSNARGPAGEAGPAVIDAATQSDGTAALYLDSIRFESTNGGPTQLGEMAWESNDGSIDAMLESGVIVAMGEDLVIRVRNTTASPITKGTALAYDGTSGASGRIEVKPWVGANIPTVKLFLGFAACDMPANSNGYSQWFGKLTEINTSGGGQTWLDEQIIYAVPGASATITNVAPTSGEYAAAAVVINAGSGTSGILFVRPTFEVASSTSATANTLVLRDANGGASFAGITLSGTGGSPFTSTLTGGVNFANRTLVLPDTSGTLTTFESLANSATITASTAVAVDTIVLRDGVGAINITSSNVAGTTAYADTAGWTYAGSAASAHRTALGLGATGSIAASDPLTVTQTWTNAAVTYTGLQVNVTDSGPSNAASMLMDLRVGGVSKMTVKKGGGIFSGAAVGTSAGGTGANGLSFEMFFSGYGIGTNGNGETVAYINNSARSRIGFGVVTSSDQPFGFTNSNHVGSAATLDTILRRDAANTLAQRNGNAAQESRIYGTYTGATNFERLSLKYNAADTAFQIGTEKGSAGGVAQPLQFRTDSTTRMAITSTGNVGIGTTSPAQKLDVVGSIKASVAVTAGANGALTNNSVSGNGYRIFAISSGVTLLDNGSGNFNRLQLGGTTSSFPAIKRNATAINIRLADDSADAPLTCSNLTASGTIQTGGYTFATLPTPTQGMRAYITDGADIPLYMANAAGGGSTVTPVFYNGTNWINA